MLLKFLLTAVLIVGALAAFRVFGSVAKTRVERTEQAARDAVRKRVSESEAMIACEHCGNYILPTEKCACREKAKS